MNVPSNIFAAFIISSLLSGLIYFIKIRCNNQEYNRLDLVRLCLFGSIIGGSNYILFSNNKASPTSLQEVMTGMPDF